MKTKLPVVICFLIAINIYAQEGSINMDPINIEGNVSEPRASTRIGGGEDRGNSKSSSNRSGASSQPTSLNLNQVNSELEETFDYYSTYFKLENYIAEYHGVGLTTIQALEAINLWEEPMNSPINQFSSPSDLRFDERKLEFSRDIMKTLSKTKEIDVMPLRAKVLAYQLYLKSKMDFRIQNYNIHINTSKDYKSIFNLYKYSVDSFNKFYFQYRNGQSNTFNSIEEIEAIQILFNTYYSTAFRTINPYSWEYESLLKMGIEPRTFAVELLKSAQSILDFANGLRKGMELSIIETKNFISSIVTYSIKTLHQPRAMMKKAWEIISSVDLGFLCSSLLDNIAKNIDVIDNGSPFDKGKVIGNFITSIFTAKIGGNLPYKKMSRYIKDEAESLVKSYKHLINNNTGAVGRIELINIMRNKIDKDFDNLIFEQSQIQKKFRLHGEDFGIKETAVQNKQKLDDFKSSLVNHINDESTIAFKGTFQDLDPKKAIHYYNDKTKINVFFDEYKYYWSSWKLDNKQRESLLRNLHLPNKEN